MSSESERSHSRERSRQKAKPEKHKMFVTNLDGTAKQEDLKAQLEQLFSKYGAVKSLEVKKSKNGQYSFAFVQYGSGEDAQEAIRNLNNYSVKGKPMKVEHQDDGKRRKDPDKGCYTCGKKGHFARQCRSKNASNYRRRSRSRSSSDDRGKKRRRRSPSDSSDRGRSRKKDRKHSKDKKDKKSKKHKKSSRYRQRSSSGSRS